MYLSYFTIHKTDHLRIKNKSDKKKNTRFNNK